MLTNAQEKLIRSLDSKKGRREAGRCLVEGAKNILECVGYLDFRFTPEDTTDFASLVDTVTPQPEAAVARIPSHSPEEIMKNDVIVVLDGVQDPGNVGTILRLCLGFDASLILIESADPTSPKVVRSSAGAFFKTPWLEVPRPGAEEALASYEDYAVYRLEKEGKGEALSFTSQAAAALPKKMMIIAGSEGQGIKLDIAGTSLSIPHNPALESLNVAIAIGLILSNIYQKD